MGYRNVAKLLVRIPLDPKIVALTDKGRSVMEGEGRVKDAYEAMAAEVVGRWKVEGQQ